MAFKYHHVASVQHDLAAFKTASPKCTASVHLSACLGVSRSPALHRHRTSLATLTSMDSLPQSIRLVRGISPFQTQPSLTPGHSRGNGYWVVGFRL